MKIDFAQALKALDGKDMLDQEGKVFTLRDAVTTSLDGFREEDKLLSGEEKKHRGALAKRIYGAKEPINLCVDDVKIVKDLVGRTYGPRVIDDVWEILDPSEPPAAEPPGGPQHLHELREVGAEVCVSDPPREKEK